MATIIDTLVTVYRMEVHGANAVAKQVDKIDDRLGRLQRNMGHMAIMWGTAFSFLGRNISDVEDQIVAIATQARIGTDQMWEFDRILRRVGMSANVTGKDMRTAVQEFVELTGDVNTAMAQSQLMADMIRGGRMSARDASALLATYYDKGITDPKLMREMVNQATFISKLGSVPIQKMGGLMPRALGLYATTGIKDIKSANAEVAASFQLINRIVRSPKKTVTAFENMTNDIADKVEKINQITGSMLTGNEGILTIMKTVADHYQKTGNKSLGEMVFGKETFEGRGKNFLSELNDIFGRRGIRGAVGFFGDGIESFEDMIAKSEQAGDVIGRDTRAWDETHYRSDDQTGQRIREGSECYSSIRWVADANWSTWSHVADFHSNHREHSSDGA